MGNSDRKKYKRPEAQKISDRERRRLRYHENPLSARNSFLKRNYGIDTDIYQSLVRIQNGVCAICGNPPDGGKPLFIDHDHVSGVTRGLLCGNCNFGLGFFKDNVVIMKRAISYLRGGTDG